MPFRLDEHRAKIQFTTSARMPSDIYAACLAVGCVSNTVYVQHAVCEALARDLGVDLDVLLAALPPPRANAHHLYDHLPVRTGPANAIEEVR